MQIKDGRTVYLRTAKRFAGPNWDSIHKAIRNLLVVQPSIDNFILATDSLTNRPLLAAPNYRGALT